MHAKSWFPAWLLSWKREENRKQKLRTWIYESCYHWKYYGLAITSEQRKNIELFRVNKQSGQMFQNRSKIRSVPAERLSLLNFLGIFDYATLKNDISAVIYSSISSYTSLERAKIKLSEKNISDSGNP